MRIHGHWFLAAVSAAAAGAAGAQSYPVKPIRILSGSLQGTGGEVALRMAATRIGAALGQSLVIENRPGANGTIAATALARAEPDGHTLGYLTSGTMVLAPLLTADVPFDSRKDFSAITMGVNTPTFFLVNAEVPAKDLAELIQYTRKNPGKFSYGAPGVGSIPHFLAETFRMASGADMFAIQYSGGGVQSMITDVLTGRTQAWLASYGNFRQHLAAGKVKAVGVYNPTRFRLLPEVPTVYEVVPGFKSINAWFSIFGPAGLPRPVIARLNADFVKGFTDAEFGAKFDELGIIAVGSTPEALAESVATGIQDMAPLVKALGLKAQ